MVPIQLNGWTFFASNNQLCATNGGTQLSFDLNTIENPDRVEHTLQAIADEAAVTRLRGANTMSPALMSLFAEIDNRCTQRQVA